MMLKRMLLVTVLGFIFSTSSIADDIPKFFKDTLPDFAAGDMLKGYGAVQGEGAALDAKTRELIGLAVAAQIPCDYCVYSHTEKLKKLGASESEIREAVAAAGYVRLWSTMLYGGSYSLDEFKAEFSKLLDGS